MREHDYGELERALRSGARAELGVLGVDFDSSAVTALAESVDVQQHDELTLAFVLSLISRAVQSELGVAYERLRAARDSVHVLVVRNERRLVLAIARSRRSHALSNAWPLLARWTPDADVERARIWARDARQGGRIDVGLVREAAHTAAAQATDEAALLSTIVASPGDDAPRLVYADWLLERGDVRGEFIRLQVEEKRRPDAKRFMRLKSLLDSSWRNFAGELAPYAVGGSMSLERGFVRTIAMTCAAFEKHGHRLLSVHPVQELQLEKVKSPTQLAQAARAEGMRLVRHLVVKGPPVFSEIDCADFARGKNFSALQTLELDDLRTDWLAFFEALDAPRLERLKLEKVGFEASLIDGLARAPRLPMLARLSFGGVPLGAQHKAPLEGFKGIAERACIRQLTLRTANEGDLLPFFGSSARCGLSSLVAASTRGSFSDGLLHAIAESKSAATLETLELEGGDFTAKGLIPIFKLPRLVNLGLSTTAAWTTADLATMATALKRVPVTFPLRRLRLPWGEDVLKLFPARFLALPKSVRAWW